MFNSPFGQPMPQANSGSNNPLLNLLPLLLAARGQAEANRSPTGPASATPTAGVGSFGDSLYGGKSNAATPGTDSLLSGPNANLIAAAMNGQFQPQPPKPGPNWLQGAPWAGLGLNGGSLT